MFDRTACHLALDCVLDEIEAGVNFANFEVSSLGLDVQAQVGPFDAKTEFFINESFHTTNKFTRHHAYAIMRQFDELADTNPEE